MNQIPSKAAHQGWFAEGARIFGTLSAHFFTLVVIFVVLIKVVPTYSVLYQEFDTELPASTQLVITLSDLTFNYWFLIFPSAMLVDTLFVVLLRLTSVTRLWLLPVWCNLWHLGVILFLFVVAVALSLPVAEITWNLAQTAAPPS